ncbi:hypothetical protein HPB51_010935 [Rhipicephalus microplus]|uniref:Peptidase C2 calpain domain-containing protein n=1 Tax=Rhipicephalus microplus TaxID=6941 RepID=A0A9J6D503_RHIMP|nr:hypothetical protein HPB51_010935 [Rhipicephalus microplus]
MWKPIFLSLLPLLEEDVTRIGKRFDVVACRRSYRLDVVEDGTVAVLAYLLQDSSSAEGSTGHFAIGMHIMQMEVNRQFRVHVIKAKVCSSEYVRARGVFLECSLQRGRYCLLPTTFEPGQARRFLLRLFCRSTLDARWVIRDVMLYQCWA